MQESTKVGTIVFYFDRKYYAQFKYTGINNRRKYIDRFIQAIKHNPNYEKRMSWVIKPTTQTSSTSLLSVAS